MTLKPELLEALKVIKDSSIDEKILSFDAVRDSLNPKTITQYANDNDIVYNTAKKVEPFITVCNTKFIVTDGK